jgi:hypothetical protein
MRSTSSTFLVAFAALLPAIAALGQNATVTTKADSSLLQLAGSGISGQILVSSEDWWGVIRAADDLAHDFGRITGKNLTLGNWSPSNSTNSTSSKRENVERAEDAVPKGWQDVPESGPQNGPQSVTRATAAGSQTTVYYWYNPVTSFINVSSFHPRLFFHKSNLPQVHSRTNSLQLHRPNPPQQRTKQENRHHRRNGQQITTHHPAWQKWQD